MELNERIENLLHHLKEVSNIAKHLVNSGELYANEDLKNRRLRHCVLCSELRVPICTICNCDVINKVSFKAASCPLKRW